jgi:hypothetical protein
MPVVDKNVPTASTPVPRVHLFARLRYWWANIDVGCTHRPAAECDHCRAERLRFDGMDRKGVRS